MQKVPRTAPPMGTAHGNGHSPEPGGGNPYTQSPANAGPHQAGTLPSATAEAGRAALGLSSFPPGFSFVPSTSPAPAGWGGRAARASPSVPSTRTYLPGMAMLAGETSKGSVGRTPPRETLREGGQTGLPGQKPAPSGAADRAKRSHRSLLKRTRGGSAPTASHLQASPPKAKAGASPVSSRPSMTAGPCLPPDASSPDQTAMSQTRTGQGEPHTDSKSPERQGQTGLQTPHPSPGLSAHQSPRGCHLSFCFISERVHFFFF